MSFAQIGAVFGFLGISGFLGIAGGVLADRWIGYRAALICAALLLIAGFGLLLPLQTSLLYPAFFMIGLGEGWELRVAPALLGIHAAPACPRRDDLFVLYAIAVTMAVPGGILLGGSLYERWGWKGVSMGATLGAGSVVVLAAGMYRRPVVPLAPAPSAENPPGNPAGRWLLWFLATVFALRAVGQVMPWLDTYWLAYYLDPEYHVEGYRRYGALAASLAAPIAAPLLLIALSASTRRQGREVSTASKVVIGILLTGISSALLLIARLIGGDPKTSSPPWLLASRLIDTAGMSVTAAAALSLAIQILPRRFLATLIGFAFLRIPLSPTADLCWAQWPPAARLALRTLLPLTVCGLFLLATRRGTTSVPSLEDNEPPTAS